MANFCEILWAKVTELDRKETKNKTNFRDMMNPRILPTPYGGRKVVVNDQDYFYFCRSVEIRKNDGLKDLNFQFVEFPSLCI